MPPKKPNRGKIAASKKSTAIARRQSKTATPPKSLLPVVERNAPLEQTRVLTPGISLGDLGLVEIKLTKEEELVLNEPAPREEIRIKPTGQAYLSHPTYTRWFNRAFGRTGWSIVPASTPMKDGRSVVQPYILYIHGKPAVYAMGEQDYHENNPEQTYGDALESTVASALRRCAKRLGVGLEMWDKQFLDEWQREYAVKVKCEVKKRGTDQVENKYLWRLKTAAPFWNEARGRGQVREGTNMTDDEMEDAIAAAHARRVVESRGPARRVDNDSGSHSSSPNPITDKQLRRLWAIIRKSSRTEGEVRDYLRINFQLAHTKDVKQRDYETICTAIEHPGALPGVTPREPGQEG